MPIILSIKKEIDFTIQQYLKHFYSGGGKVGKSIEVHPPTSLKEKTSDNLGLFKHAPINFRKLLLSPEGLLFFLSWGSTIQVIIFCATALQDYFQYCMVQNYYLNRISLTTFDLFQGMLVNGFVNVAITSLERRFDLKSAQSGFIASSYDLGSLLAVIPISYFGGLSSASKPRLYIC